MSSEEDENFPGLNKRHGFYKVIQRNQVSRDDYHKKQELWREQKKKELDAEISSRMVRERRQRRGREDKRPDRTVYRPPKSTSNRHFFSNDTSPLYRLEIEVKPGIIWNKEITKYGSGRALARTAAFEYGLDNQTERALTDFIREFEAQLKLK